MKDQLIARPLFSQNSRTNTNTGDPRGILNHSPSAYDINLWSVKIWDHGNNHITWSDNE